MGFPDGFRSGPGARKSVSIILTSLYLHCPFTSPTPALVRRSTTASGLPYGGCCAAQPCPRADPGIRSRRVLHHIIFARFISIHCLSDFYGVIQKWRLNLLKPVRGTGWNDNHVSSHQRLRYATVQLVTANFVVSDRPAVRQSSAGNESRRSFDHIDKV